MMYSKSKTWATIISSLLASFILFFLTRFSEKAVAAIVENIKNNVSPCNVSTSVKEVDSGNDESIMYLLPTTANKDPTLKPKRESIPSE